MLYYAYQVQSELVSNNNIKNIDWKTYYYYDYYYYYCKIMSSVNYNLT